MGASAIPMYTKEIRPKFFSAIPIYDLINNKSFQLTEKERKRIERIQLMSTKVLLGKELGINELKKNYFFINNSYYDLVNLKNKIMFLMIRILLNSFFVYFLIELKVIFLSYYFCN